MIRRVASIHSTKSGACRQAFVADKSEKTNATNDSSTDSVRAYRGAFPSPAETKIRAPKYVPPVDSDTDDTQTTNK